MSNPLRATLPWPHRDLSPNARVHWARLAKAKALARGQAFFGCRAAGMRPTGATRAVLTITFRPPDKRARDLDNMVAAFKAGSDGVADALGVDDARWQVRYAVGDVVKGGAVVVEVVG